MFVDWLTLRNNISTKIDTKGQEVTEKEVFLDSFHESSLSTNIPHSVNLSFSDVNIRKVSALCTGQDR